MKNILTFIFAVLLFSSCSNFLEEHSQDLIIPKDVNHYKELVYGDLIQRKSNVAYKTDLMSDDVGSTWKLTGTTDDRRKDEYQYYTWQNSTEYNFEGKFSEENMYSKLYADVVLCNAIENLLPDASGDKDEKLQVMGEVHFFRALSYFDLANLYGVPYVDEASALTTSCVPLNNNKGIAMDVFQRATQAEVYGMMTDDIVKAVDEFEKADVSNTIYRPNFNAACILATRVFLCQKKYDKVIEYANKIQNINQLYSLSEYVKTYGVISDVSQSQGRTHFMSRVNSEITFTYSDEYFVVNFAYDNVAGYYHPTKALLNSYEEDDLREDVYFDSKGLLSKASSDNATAYSTSFRLSEALLNRAEAYAHKDESKALIDLNTLRNFRFEGTPPQVNGNILEAVKAERRKELCFEGFRWYDLRRWGMPKIMHEYPLEDGTRKEIWTLNQGDAAYTLALPVAVTNINTIIKQHQRPNREANIINL